MDDLKQFKDTYITECHELLADMEEKLMGLDDQNTNLDDLNAIFRCAHSIKGGAGAFGFDRITKFTHILEALLDSMREGIVQPTREAIDALLRSVDVVTQLVAAAQAGEEAPADLGKDVIAELEAVAHDKNVSVGAKTEVVQEVDIPEDEITLYAISFVPHENLFTSGNEPLLMLRELQTLGEVNITPDLSRLPKFHDLNIESCYLAWKVELETMKPEKAIKEVFEFVEDDCELTITSLGGFSIPKPPVSAAESNIKEDDEDDEQSAPIAQGAKKEAIAQTANAGGAKAAAAVGVTSIRVDVDKVDKLVNMVGELVITQAVLVAQSRDMPADQYPELLNAITELSQHTRELQEAVMSVRMQPVKSIFSRMPRIVRDVSTKLGKDIVLEMFGENTEVDKTVIEQLSDPLTHMIRNSVDHGIEKPDARKLKGKSAQGTIKLSADHRGGRIVLEISDDGNGINREIVLQKAKEKGLVAPEASLSNEEIDYLIFMPGFSTAAEVTDISGRGVGMDVVKRNIEMLGGTIQVKNRPGEGSTMTVMLPLTLAILDGMIVRVGREHYIVPINNIIETLRPKKEEVRKIANGNDLINVRGEFISILYLHRLFSIKDAIADPSEALLVLVENGNEKFGLVVDELIGQQQVVIKTLKEYASAVRGISGATILGDGKVSLILDIADLQQISHSMASDYVETNVTIADTQLPIEDNQVAAEG